jgi:hypothetical protein
LSLVGNLRLDFYCFYSWQNPPWTKIGVYSKLVFNLKLVMMDFFPFAKFKKFFKERRFSDEELFSRRAIPEFILLEIELGTFLRPLVKMH